MLRFLLACAQEGERTFVRDHVSAIRTDVAWHEARDVRSARTLATTAAVHGAIVSLELPREPGGRVEAHEQRITRDHRVVDAGFPGLALVRDLITRLPPSRVALLVRVADDHPDVRAARDLGVRVLTLDVTAADEIGQILGNLAG